MITAMRICLVPDGALSIFDTDNFYLGAPYYALDVKLDQKPLWYIQNVPNNHRIIIPDSVDVSVDRLKTNLDEWLKLVENEGDGTLFFTVRSIYAAPGEEPKYFLGGMVFIPRPEGVEIYNDIGLPLEGEDPRTLINLVLDEDREHPFIRRFLELDVELRAEATDRYQAERAEQEREYGVAMQRSRILLLGMLSPQQTADLEQHHYFEVTGQDGRLYRITDKDHQNVYLIQDGKPLIRYCAIMANWRIPVYDLLLAQKLLIESDLDRFMEVANQRRLDIIEPNRTITIGPNGPDYRIRTGFEREIRRLLEAIPLNEPVLVQPVRLLTVRPIVRPEEVAALGIAV